MLSPPPASSPERIRVDGPLNRVPEVDEPAYHDDEWVDEDLLESEGLYRGSYKRLVLLYTLAPLTIIVTIALLAFLPQIAYHDHKKDNDYPYPALLPYPIPEILLPAALFALTHLLRPTLSAIPNLLISESLTATLISTVLTSILSTFARLISLCFLLIQSYAKYKQPTWHDPAFIRIWWAGLGWAAAEGVVAVAQGYSGLALYRDVLVTSPIASSGVATPDSTEQQLSASVERTPLLPRRTSSYQSSIPHPMNSSTILTDPDTELENDLDQLLALKARDELEDVLGLPLVYIPPFIPPLQRINAILLSLGLFLLLGVSLSVHGPIAVLLIGLAAATHALLSTLHAPGVLPRVGLHSAAFISAVVSLGVLFTGLGVWGGVS
ncbi:hypothetical protein MIND_00971800 [Mycena indigotica]|uniref:Uncharacterized protein n=1 Tax=Mycena indigotica TaxID=2126181 RepID=A0A8H6SEC3_9AGAR|nr:uncharacterized protein MIND_00971800 [Mycena indigotica]KAF7297383.1 hypothetical protein MIND_00971800 [Mycena indigotica]